MRLYLKRTVVWLFALNQLASCSETPKPVEDLPPSAPRAEETEEPSTQKPRSLTTPKADPVMSDGSDIESSVALEAPNPVDEEDVNLLDRNYLSNRQEMLVDAYKLNVRSGPGDQFPVRRSLRKGDKVTIRAKSGVWVQISSHEWVSEVYLKPAQ